MEYLKNSASIDEDSSKEIIISKRGMMKLSVNYKTMTATVKGYDKSAHKEIIYKYVVEGLSGEKSGEGYTKNTREISAILKAYNFNKSRGSSSGMYKHIASRDDVDRFIDKYYPGFVDDDSIAFDDFLGNSARTKTIHPASKSRESIPGKKSKIQNKNENSNDRETTREKFDFGSFSLGDIDSSFPQTIGIIGVTIMIAYYLIGGIAMPALDLGMFSLTSAFQKDLEIESTQLKDHAYAGEMGWMKKPDGLGLLNLDKSKKYIGRFKNGKRQGEGIEIFDDGTIGYMGIYNAGKYDDFGMIVGDEDIYIGEMKKGKKDGMGAYFDTSNGIIEINEYKKDKIKKQEATINHTTAEAQVIGNGGYQIFDMDNDGVLVGDHKKSNFTVNVADGYVYFGMYKDGATNGYGIRINSNGNVEFGNKKGKKLEEAILYMDEQAVSIGEFKGQTKEGFGLEYIFSGEMYLGNYSKSRRHGKGTYMHSNGRTEKVKYKDGVFLGK